MNDRQLTKRLPYLDSARGLATISVMTVHFLFAVYGADVRVNYGETSMLFLYGEANMLFFFIHSGFILSYSYAGEDRKFSLKYYIKFLIERIFRIYPLFLVILFLSFLAFLNTPSYTYTNEGRRGYVEYFWYQQMDWTDLLNQAVLFIRIPDLANLRLIPQDWTLTVELLAGAGVPLLAFAGKKNLAFFLLLLALLKANNFLTTYILEFGIGVFLFLVWKDILNIWNRFKLWAKIFFAIATLILYTCFFSFPSFFAGDVVFIDSRIDRLIVAVGCALLFILLLSSTKIQYLLSFTFLTGIGKICYSIYLLHQMLILICWRLYPSFFHSLHKNNPLIILSVYLVYFIMVILLSKVFFKLVEQPMNRLGKRITARFLEGNSANSPAS